MKLNYKKAISTTEEALDLINLKDFLIKGKELKEIIDWIKEYIQLAICDDEVELLKDFMESHSEVFASDIFNGYDLFNYITEDEFLDYCRKRYPEIHWGSEVIERHWVL